MPGFLTADKTEIRCDGRKVTLTGVNLGGWLLMEAYILHAPNLAEQKFKKEFADRLGERALAQFEKNFRDHFIQEKDVAAIASWGMTCLRVPFNATLVENAPYRYEGRGVAYLDRVIRWAKKYGIRVILDLHAAPGAQNHDWHSDSLGEALLWKDKSFQARTLRLWEFLAERYKDEPAIAGYDILNEAVLQDTKLLNRFYKELIAAIRSIDRNHLLFIEGNRWAQDLDCLDDFADDNLALSVHYYQPMEFTFNLISFLRYPLRADPERFDRRAIRKVMEGYAKLAQKRKRPVYLGEFGVNARCGLFGEDAWVRDVVSCCREFDFHWTYWTYKAVKNHLFPDGIYSLVDNLPWVNRAGPLCGWDTYATHWPKRRVDMIRSWETKAFTLNKEILHALKSGY